MAEDDLVRGVHPMVGRRLNLWRLRDFDLTRLEAPEDVLLYDVRRRGATRPTSGSSRWPRCASSPSCATRTGRVIALPHAERAVANCLEAIRRARAAPRRRGRQLDMNHVWVHIWPLVEADLEQLTALQAQDRAR